LQKRYFCVHLPFLFGGLGFDPAIRAAHTGPVRPQALVLRVGETKERMSRRPLPSTRRPGVSGFANLRVLVLAVLLQVGAARGEAVFRVASYNLENYLTEARGSRPAKPEAARQRICEAVRRIQPDVLAVQEIGGAEALVELQGRLKAAQIDLPHLEIVGGFDTNIQVALLSRFPITARRSHPEEALLVRGRRYRTTRGILDVDITLPSTYRFTLLGVHLKSRRETGGISQQDLREQEARVVRRLVDQHLRSRPEANLIVVGDFNDDPASLTLRTVVGRGGTALLDTRPAEREGDLPGGTRSTVPTRTIAWTHFYAREDLYSRLDYVLISPGMSREWRPASTWVLTFANWGEASDHRPIVATFAASDR
jgi:endonuclease/exonuclease/phosphatase family metal-dependent hydrolase